MTQTFKQQIGQKGEQLAADYLVAKGFTLVDRNYRRPWGEIDLIVRRKGEWRFVEVKTVTRERLRSDDYDPEENIHPWKQKRLRRIIETYLLQSKEDFDWQVDAISVYLSPTGDLLKIDWLEDIVI